MGKCNIDHSLSDVKGKLESQRHVLPQTLFNDIALFLTQDREQTILNECFHLLKKYDLIDENEREDRNKKLYQLIF